MRDRFDWTPWIGPEELIVWRGGLSRIEALSAGLLGIGFFGGIAFLAANMMMEEAGRSECVGNGCPPEHHALFVVVLLGMVVTAVMVIVTPLLLCFENHYAVTSRRIVHFHSAVWRKAPRVKSLPLERVKLEHYGKGSRTVKVRDAESPAWPWLEYGGGKSHRSNRAFAAAIEAAKTVHADNPPSAHPRSTG